MKISILDEGRLRYTDMHPNHSYKLFIDREYIGAVEVTDDGDLIMVSILHAIEFRKDD